VGKGYFNYLAKREWVPHFHSKTTKKYQQNGYPRCYCGKLLQKVIAVYTGTIKIRLPVVSVVKAVLQRLFLVHQKTKSLNASLLCAVSLVFHPTHFSINCSNMRASQYPWFEYLGN